MSSRTIETVAVLAIALAMLVGGTSLLVTVSHLMPFSALVLLAIGVSLAFSMMRGLRLGGPLARLHASRDIAFLAAVLAALAFVFHPARWALGAAIAAVEFGLILELMARFVPPPAEPTSRT